MPTNGLRDQEPFLERFVLWSSWGTKPKGSTMLIGKWQTSSLWFTSAPLAQLVGNS
jgi:hypothetical protein